MTGQPRVMTDPAATMRYALAGRAVVTLRSAKTGAHYTYRLEAPSGPHTGSDRRFVKVLRERDQWAYIGMVFEHAGGTWTDFSTTAKSTVGAAAPCAKAFAFFWAHVSRGRAAPDLEVRHEGHCGRCGRPLTTPESVDRGLGPDCAFMRAKG